MYRSVSRNVKGESVEIPRDQTTCGPTVLIGWVPRVWVARDDGGCGPTIPIRLAPRVWAAGVGDADYIIRSCDIIPTVM